jgi:glycine cleavage system H lipoate-binding protein
MTVLLVLLTIILFIVTDSIVQRVRRARAAQALEPLRAGVSSEIPEGIALAFNHTWMREEKKGLWTIGIDGFLTALTGAVESILLPPVETRVVPASSAIALRDHGKELHVSLPVPGTVVEVNNAVLKNPSLATSSPYEDGWLVRVRPFDRPAAGVRRVAREETSRWLRDQTDRVKEFLTARLPQPVLMQDGGLPVRGLLKEFSPEVWREFQETFVVNEPER